ncbi:MAG: tetratricopeptide repeat protein [Candidatus Poribacteria bacterium]|nr:tetratricopeptide repeat protein [Candidatus Poribacteria bacterium]
MLAGTQRAKNVLPLLAPPTPTQPSMFESQKQTPFVTQPSLLLKTMKVAPYSESDYRWLAYVLELLIEIGNRDKDFSFNTVLRSDYRQLSPLLEELVDTVGENIHHPATSLMMLVGFLVERYETENVPKLSELPPEPIEEEPVEWNDEWEIIEINDLTPEEMQELEKDHPPAAILKWTETEVAIHAFFSMGNILSEGGWVREAISAYDMALRLKPDYAETYYNRGTAKTLIGEYETAIADFDEAIRLNPEFVEAHYNRSQTKVSLSQIEEARYDLEIALKLAEKQECDHIKSNIQRCLRELVNVP